MTSLPDLLAQRAAVDAKIAAHKQDMVRQVLAVMEQLGVTLDDLGVHAARKAEAPAKRPIKYRDAKGNTWTGVGQRPRWLQTAVLAGAALEDFRVR